MPQTVRPPTLVPTITEPRWRGGGRGIRVRTPDAAHPAARGHRRQPPPVCGPETGRRGSRWCGSGSSARQVRTMMISGMMISIVIIVIIIITIIIVIVIGIIILIVIIIIIMVMMMQLSSFLQRKMMMLLIILVGEETAADFVADLFMYVCGGGGVVFV